MDSAAISGLSTSPKMGSKTPAAIGNAMASWPIAQPRFCRILPLVVRTLRRRRAGRIRATHCRAAGLPVMTLIMLATGGSSSANKPQTAHQPTPSRFLPNRIAVDRERSIR
jgi:hypothetical protein